MFTAYCRNPYDGQWYAFDDTRVESVQESDVVTTSAYILFYQHRSLSAASGSSSSASSSSSSEHWVFRMPAFDYAPPPAGSKSSEELSSKGWSSVMYFF
jgi:ubiquitin carboxyl-terminal hydrolase 31